MPHIVEAEGAVLDALAAIVPIRDGDVGRQAGPDGAAQRVAKRPDSGAIRSMRGSNLSTFLRKRSSVPNGAFNGFSLTVTSRSPTAIVLMP